MATARTLRFDYRYTRISISVFPSAQPPGRAHFRRKTPAEDSLIDLLTRASTTLDNDVYDEIVEDVLRFVFDVGKVIFDGIRSCRPRTPEPDLRSPPSLYFRLLTLSGELSLVPIEPENAYTCVYTEPDNGSEDDVDTNEDLFSTEEFPLAGGDTVYRAVADEEPILCEAHQKEICDEILGRA